LALIEQKVLAVGCLHNEKISEEKLTKISESQNWDDLFLTSNGNPWLTRKLIPLLTSYNVEDLTKHSTKYLKDDTQETKITQFYEWQWNLMDPLWQRLLILCAETKGLLLEMFMTAFDQAESFAPAQSLISILSNEVEGGSNKLESTSDAENVDSKKDENKQKFQDAIQHWRSAGFVTRFPHGHIVAQKCLSFVKAKRSTGLFKHISEDKYQLYFSQIVCEGIRLLSRHVIQQPNPNISNNLLINRRVWVGHFEKLWFNKDFKGFIGVKNSFEQLMQQAKLERETNEWLLKLLDRSPLPGVTDKTTAEEKLAWLSLVTGVLNSPQAKDSPKITSGAEIWQTWFDTFAETGQNQQLSLLQQVSLFLDRYYQIQTKWKSCIAITKKMLDVYTRYDAWQMICQSLKSLSRYHYELGETEQALAYENRILNDIPYTESPPGFKTKQLVDVLLTRVAYAQLTDAQALLNQIRDAEDVEQYSEMLNGIQSEIHFLEGDYSRALSYYCEVWVKAIQENIPAKIEQLKLRLFEIEGKMGISEFERYFESEVPEGTVKPREYSTTAIV
ncbi:MAG: hypothetical protein OQK04_08120, partial [Kangiellaceae bacterium]|nr:hypothetical protein [Kangiellaceae bacterium]